MALFHRHLNATGKFAAWLSQRSFAVYVLHAPVLVALTLGMRPLAADAFTHMAVLTVVGLVASYLVADPAKRLPIIGEALRPGWVARVLLVKRFLGGRQKIIIGLVAGREIRLAAGASDGILSPHNLCL